MARFFLRLLGVTFLLLSFNLNAQTTEIEPTLDENNVEGQFEYLYKKAGNWQDYRLVKKVLLDRFRKNILDSIAAKEEKLASTQKLNEAQSNEINTLKASLEETNNNLAAVSTEKDSITFFGTQIVKSTYKTIMWGIISALVLIIFYLAYKFKNANTITQEAKKTLLEVEEEYEDYRRKALEREQKVRRQLQDEINKQKMTKTK
ncbi:tRNA (guanine-N1)-methyltransferase [Abyssalbus ytuae]|uniref:tRNA (Guanine-N1)-methyltransferase n=1 Tax=Abyssalbus ytuae TaxID=2926907 RepID=A0A9E7D1M9_9FLAO|nr:tRNA (guanine-N1)-methyltransferase [Abyssalbus ytuae]UOB17288.1 tRNA (guanine-N1)-methyltransferase [Abyssalbus ytuae]